MHICRFQSLAVHALPTGGPTRGFRRHPVTVPLSTWTARLGRLGRFARTRAAVAPEAVATESALKAPAVSKGHSALMHGLGDVGLIPAQMMPLILRIAHVVGKGAVNVRNDGEGSREVVQDGSLEEVEKKTAVAIPISARHDDVHQDEGIELSVKSDV